MSKSLALKPRMSEKSYDQSHAQNTYTFDVPLSSNKVEVARAVAAQYEVTVTNVRVSVLKGKQARSIRIGGTRKAVSGKRPDVKKAYVTVKKGENIPIFAAIDEAEEKERKLEEKMAKSEKKAAKSTKTEAKTVKKSEKPEKTVVLEKPEKTEQPDKTTESEEKAKGRLSLKGFMLRRRGKK